MQAAKSLSIRECIVKWPNSLGVSKKHIDIINSFVQLNPDVGLNIDCQASGNISYNTFHTESFEKVYPSGKDEFFAGKVLMGARYYSNEA